MARVGIIDYGSGNFASVWNAVSSIGANVQRITKPEEFEHCSHLILPGVGAFNAAMKKLLKLRIRDELLEQMLIQRKQFLGICVGMQLLASRGLEFEESEGLNVIHGTVKRFEIDESQYRLPHIGWNNVYGLENSPLFKNIANTECFYFLHSFHLEAEQTLAGTVWSEYGIRFISAISIENVHGVQFHPEKSQQAGLKLLSNFIFRT